MAKVSLDFEIQIRCRLTNVRSAGKDEPDPAKDVFSIWITNHPTCKQGKPRRVAFTGCQKVFGESGEQVAGRICWIAQHKLEKRDRERILKFVTSWQADPEAIERSRADLEEQW